MKEFDAEKLKEEYQVKPKKTNFEEAKKLDRKCKLPVYIFTYTFGIIGALILGIGMCLAMNVIGGGTTLMITLGIIIGLIGIVIVSVNYPLYSIFLRKRKEKYSSAILLELNKSEE